MTFDRVHIDGFFRRKLYRYKAEPPEDVWYDIYRYLESRKKQRRRTYMRLAAVLAALVVAGSLLFTALPGLFSRPGNEQMAHNDRSQSMENFVRSPAGNPSNPGITGNSAVSDPHLLPPGGSGSMAPLSNQDEASGGSSDQDGPSMGLALADPSISDQENDGSNQDIETNTGHLTRKKSLIVTLPAGEADHQALAQTIQGELHSTGLPSDNATLSNNPPLSPQTVLNGGNLSSDPLTGESSLTSPAETSPEKKYSALTIKAALSPLMSFRDVEGGTGGFDYNTSESRLFSYSGGINFGLSFSRRLTVRSGLYYSQLGQTLSKIVLGSDDFHRSGDDIFVKLNNSLGEVRVPSSRLIDAKPPESIANIVDGSKLRKFSYTLGASVVQRFEYLRIPLMLEYTVVDKRMDVNVLGGLHSNFLVNEGVYLKNDQGATHHIGNTSNISRFNYSGTFALGLEYALGNQMNMYLEPTVDYFLNPINQDETKTYPYSFAVYTGLSISF